MTVKIATSLKSADLLLAFWATEAKKNVLLSTNPVLNTWFSSLKKSVSPEGFKWAPENSMPAQVLQLIEYKALAENPAEGFRRLGSAVAKAIRGKETGNVGIDLTGFAITEDTIHAFAEGFFLGLYQFDQFKTLSVKKTSWKSVSILVADSAVSNLQKRVDSARTLTESQNWARQLVNRPANDLNAEILATETAKRATEMGYSVSILDKKKIKALKMGGLLAVNKGSKNDPAFIIAEYKHQSVSGKPVVLVGKGVTFDTGGISIKPAAGMGDMKGDMAGAAAVLATVDAAARLKLKTHVVALVPATDNMPGGNAQCPGDIITTMSGITVEVDNTDAEGRLILADALEYAKQYDPVVLIDLATLTGACVVALGTQAAGLMSNREDLSTNLIQAGQKSYERVWPLPLFEEYNPQIKSDVADVKNVGGRNAGAITAGKFLQKFVDEKQPWAHIDIAGPSFLDAGDHYLPKGATGFGVRLLIEFLRSNHA